MVRLGIALAIAFLGGCAGGINFGGDEPGLAYFEAVPHLFVSRSPECVFTATVVMIPGTERRLTFENGYGSSNFSVGLTNGMLTSVNQQSDTKVPETITAIAGLAPVTGALAAAPPGAKKTCEPAALLYKITNGVVGSPVELPAS
jgi:hypothetical protein